MKKMIFKLRTDFMVCRYHEQSREEIIKQQPLYAEVRKRPPRIDDNKEYVNTSQVCS